MKILKQIGLVALLGAITPAFAQTNGSPDSRPPTGSVSTSGESIGVVRGSTTVRSHIQSTLPTSSAIARQGGSAGEVTIHTGQTGFGCKVGEWGIQDGVIKCVTPTGPVISDFGTKAVYIKFAMPSPANPSTITLMRITGSAGSGDTITSLRVDLFDAEGGVAKATAPCFISAPNTPCNMGSATGPGAAAQLNTNPKLPDGQGVQRYADYLYLNASSVAGVGNTGTQYSDNYYVTTISMDEAWNLNIYAAGMFAQTNSSVTRKLLGPIVGKGRVTASDLASAPNQKVYTFNGNLRQSSSPFDVAR